MSQRIYFLSRPIRNIVFITVLLAFVWSAYEFSIRLIAHEYDDPTDTNVNSSKIEVPHFELPVLGDTANFALESLKGKPVVLHFWATWCPPCIEELPQLISFIEKFQGQVQLVLVSEDNSAQEAQVFLSRLSVNSNLIHSVIDVNGQLAKKMKATKLPETFLLSKEHKVFRQVSGSRNWDKPFLQKQVESLL